MSLLVGVGLLVVLGLGVRMAWLPDPGGSARQATDKKPPPPVDGRPVWIGLGEKAFEEAPLQLSRRAQRRAFRLLHGRSERIPPPIGNQIRRSIGALPEEFDFEFTHWIPGTGGLWVVGGENLTCIAYNRGRQTACDTAIRAARRGLALGVATVPRATTGRPEKFVVIGLVPNQVEVAQVKVGKKTRHVPVESNTYVVRARERIILRQLASRP